MRVRRTRQLGGSVWQLAQFVLGPSSWRWSGLREARRDKCESPSGNLIARVWWRDYIHDLPLPRVQRERREGIEKGASRASEYSTMRSCMMHDM